MATLSMTGLIDVLHIRSSAKWSHKESPETHPSVRSLVKRLIDIFGGNCRFDPYGNFVDPRLRWLSNSVAKVQFCFTKLAVVGWVEIFKFGSFARCMLMQNRRKKQVENQATGAFFKNDNDPPCYSHR